MNKRLPAAGLASAFYTATDLAVVFGVGERCIWKWTTSGRLPQPIRRGRKWARWARPMIDGLIAEWAVGVAKGGAA